MNLFSCHFARPDADKPMHNCYTLWFRVAGPGIHFRWVCPGYQPLFSEWHGHIKVLRIGQLWIKVLPHG